jgi:hypothetical protein
LPQARQAQRFDHEEKDDERAEQDQGQVGHQPRGKGEAERALLPAPPMMIMNRILKERSRSNPAPIAP